MKKIFGILIIIGLALSSCDKEEKATPKVPGTAGPSPTSERNGPTLQQIYTSGPGPQGILTCGWSDGFGTGQEVCEGDHCAVTYFETTSGTLHGITCFDGAIPLHTENYR